MPEPRKHLATLLAHWEKRSVQLLTLLGLGLVVVLAPVVPFADPPDNDVKVTLVPTPTPKPKPEPALVLPPPSLADRESRAVYRLAQRGQIIRAGGGHRRLVALTFDDGPGPYTIRLLKVLKRLHVHATFFQVGRMLDQFSEAARAESAAPHIAIGDHTYNHPSLNRLSRHDQATEIVSTARAMIALGEVAPQVFRPPYGLFTSTTLALARRNGLAAVTWNVDSEDYTRPGTARIVRNVLHNVKPGSIVLMHDAGGDRSQTIAALPAIVKHLRERGYGLVTVPELLYEDPPPIIPATPSTQPVTPEITSAATPTKSPAPRTTRPRRPKGR